MGPAVAASEVFGAVGWGAWHCVWGHGAVRGCGGVRASGSGDFALTPLIRGADCVRTAEWPRERPDAYAAAERARETESGRRGESANACSGSGSYGPGWTQMMM